MTGDLAGHWLLAGAWVVWCALHSLLAAPRVSRRVAGVMGSLGERYRLFYNIFAAVSILPVLLCAHALDSPSLVRWGGPWLAIPVLCWILAGWLGLLAARAYDLREFLGLARQTRKREALVTTGVLGVVRHPWYLAALLVLWGRNLDGAALVTSAILTLYLLVGMRLEELKLLDEFGDEYRRYRRLVPALFPRFRRKDGSGRGVR